MKTKEEMLVELEELETKLIAYEDQPKRSRADVREINATVDRMDEIEEDLAALRSGAAVARVREPVGSSPRGSFGQPGTGGNTRPPFGDEQLEKFGEYLQAIFCASPGVDGGQQIGRFVTGKVDRSVIYEHEIRGSSGLEESTPSLGGFLVGSDDANMIFEKAYARSVVWQRCRPFPISTNSNSIKIPGVDETSRADGSRQGGIRSYWESEGGTLSDSKPKFNAVEMSAKKLIGLAYATDELIQDAGLLAEFITAGFEREFAFKLDDAAIRGTGAGQPLGILNGPCLVSISGSSSANTIVAADVLGMYARLWPGSERDAIWIANKDTVPQLMALNTAADGTGAPLWLPANNVSGVPFQTMIGKELHFVEQCATLGDVGDLILADFSQFGAASKGQMQSAVSIHVKFSTDETAFRFVLRVDGQPMWSSAVTPYQGTDTQSPFIAIATRS